MVRWSNALRSRRCVTVSKGLPASTTRMRRSSARISLDRERPGSLKPDPSRDSKCLVLCRDRPALHAPLSRRKKAQPSPRAAAAGKGDGIGNRLSADARRTFNPDGGRERLRKRSGPARGIARTVMGRAADEAAAHLFCSKSKVRGCRFTGYARRHSTFFLASRKETTMTKRDPIACDMSRQSGLGFACIEAIEVPTSPATTK